MRVSLGQRRGDPAQPGCEHHRPCHVATPAQDDVRPAAREDPPAGERRRDRLPERANQREARTPWEPRDVERVEREAGPGDEPSLDAIRRPGERHGHASIPERLRHRERRPDVTGGPARGDQARELAG